MKVSIAFCTTESGNLGFRAFILFSIVENAVELNLNHLIRHSVALIAIELFCQFPPERMSIDAAKNQSALIVLQPAWRRSGFCPRRAAARPQAL
ncbi:hypothetical protein D3C73_1491490 [compost metagenome]